MSNIDIIETARSEMTEAFSDRDALIGDSFGKNCACIPFRNVRSYPGYDPGMETLLVDVDRSPTDHALDIRARISPGFENDSCARVSENESTRDGHGTESGLVDGLSDLLRHAGGLDYPGMPMAFDGTSPCAAPQSLAFYLPFHHFTSRHWGIHLTLEGVCRIAWWIRHLSERRLIWCQCVEAARIFLQGHMQAHHNIEMFALRLEIMGGGRPVYDDGFNRHHLRAFGTASGLQETYANAYAIRRYRSSNRGCGGRGLNLMMQTFKKMLEVFPPAWQGGADHLCDTPFMNLCTELKYELHRESFPEKAGLSSSLWRGGFMPLDGLPDLTTRVRYLVPRSVLASKPIH